MVRVTKATGRLVTVEENVLAGGFGTAVLEALTERHVKDFTPLRLGMPDAFVEQAAAAVQRKILGLDGQGIAQRILETFYPHMAVRNDEAPVAAGQAARV